MTASTSVCTSAATDPQYGGSHSAVQHGRAKRRVAPAFALLAALLSLFAMSFPLAALASRPLRVVALGDSLTAGYMLPQDAAFPEQLEKALKAQGVAVEIQNAGVSGDTASQGLERLDWSVPDGTDAVIVELGANDALRGVDPAVTRKALDEIIARLKARNIAVLLAGMYAPRNMGADYVQAFDGIYRDLAAKHGVPLYPFFLDGIAGDRALNLQDGLHPNPQGVKVIVSRILPAVTSFLNTVKPGA
ncbi:arylesterase [Alsobacter soli]|uniref:Arylesterase n=1 Tax=Alsobacter soli TaxID=2109933 RepID=A0A2T1HZX9_9HYPH|nr:arylesterase [Alsobacter soli]